MSFPVWVKALAEFKYYPIFYTNSLFLRNGILLTVLYTFVALSKYSLIGFVTSSKFSVISLAIFSPFVFYRVLANYWVTLLFFGI